MYVPEVHDAGKPVDVTGYRWLLERVELAVLAEAALEETPAFPPARFLSFVVATLR
jgi:hypothetical protein